MVKKEGTEFLKTKKFWIILAILEIVGVWLFYHYGYTVPVILEQAFLLAVLLYVAFLDQRTMTIPNRVVLLTLGVRVIFLIIECFMNPGNAVSLLIKMLVGMAVLLITFFAVYFFSRGGIGGGDVKLVAVIGFYMGLRAGYMAMVVSLLIAMVFSLIGLARKKLTMKDKIAFGPFLAIGTIITLLLGA